MKWENVEGKTQLSCVLCIILFSPGMKTRFSLISLPLSCLAQLAN